MKLVGMCKETESNTASYYKKLDLKRIRSRFVVQNPTMELPKFLLGDNSEFPDDIFIIHLDFPRFIINLKNDEVELLEEVTELDENELQLEMAKWILEAGDFYDNELRKYEE